MEHIKYNIEPFPTSPVKNDISISSNIHKVRPKTRRNRFHQKAKRRCNPKGDDDPAGRGLLKKILSTAEFTNLSKLGCFALLGQSIGCRSPPLFLILFI